MNMGTANVFTMALAILLTLATGLSSCAEHTNTNDLLKVRAIEAEPTGKDLTILQAWSGDFPVAELGRLPANQVNERVGYIGDKATFAAIWEAMYPSRQLPVVDFTENIVVFFRNTAFYNRASIGKVVLKDGIAEVIAIETMSALPIENKAAMVLAVISRTGVEYIQTGSKLIPVLKESSNEPINAAYSIEGRRIRLSHGAAEVESVPGSMTKGMISVFGKPVLGDLDGDDDNDSALILVHNPGGSGTFFYVAASLNNNGAYEGTNAVLIGDRVAPHDLNIRNGVIVASFAERRPSEPMSVPPTVGETKYLTVKADTLAEIQPPKKGEQVLEGWVTIGNEVRSFLPCSQKRDLWLAGNSPALKDIISVYNASLPASKIYTPLFMTLAGSYAPKPTNEFGLEYEASFFATQLVRVWPNGKCR